MNIFGLNITKRSQPFQTIMLDTPSIYTTLETDTTSIACMDLIANSIAGLSINLYDRRNRQKVVSHPLVSLLKNPNFDETKHTFFYQMTLNYFQGGAFIYKYTDGYDIKALFNWSPNSVSVMRDSQNQKIYSYNGRQYDYQNVLHIPSRWNYNGDVGQSIFAYARDTFDLTKKIDSYTNNTYDNSLGKRLVIDISDSFPSATPEQIESLRQKYIANYQGAANAAKPIVKTNKIKFENLDSGITDSRSNQLIENRTFQAGEISKLFGVPLSFLTGENTYGNIESLYTILMDTAVRPITDSFQEYFNKMLAPNERENLYFEFDFNSLLKTDLTTRIDCFNKQLYSGILSVNEVRALENREPIEAGDTHWMPSNNIPIRQDVTDAMLSSAKLKAEQLMNPNPATGIGSDKL